MLQRRRCTLQEQDALPYSTVRIPDTMNVKQCTEYSVSRFGGCRSLATTSSRGATPLLIGNPCPRRCFSYGTTVKLGLIVMLLLMLSQMDVRAKEL